MQDRIKLIQESITTRYPNEHYIQAVGKGSVCLTYGDSKGTCVGYLFKKKRKKNKMVFYSWVGRRSLKHNPIVEKQSLEDFTSKVVEKIRQHLKDIHKEHTKILFKEKQKKLFQLEVEAITKEIFEDYSSYKNSSGISIGQNVVVTKSDNRRYYVQMKERMSKEEYVEFLHFYKMFKKGN